MEPLSFHDYICGLDPATLPRVLKICSGVYFQGSVYEVDGSECCLSTGDLMKITHVQLQKVICENPDTGQTRELPLDFSGHFRPIPRSMAAHAFDSLEALVAAATAAPGGLPVCFTSAWDLHVGGRVLPGGQPVTLTSVELRHGQRHGRCKSGEGAAGSPPLLLPLALSGQFQWWEPDSRLTLLQALRCQALRTRRFHCANLHWAAVVLSPLYEVQAIMQMRKDIVKIPSSLEVDVEDVTAVTGHVHFVKPVLLSEVLARGGPFPVEAEILEGPAGSPIFESAWTGSLRKGQRLRLHGHAPAWRLLATAGRKAPRHFLVSSEYRGLLRRRPREFPTAFDLLAGLGPGGPLRVVVTRDCEGEGLAMALGVGDRLEVLGPTHDGGVAGLECARLGGPGEPSEDRELLVLPLPLAGGFVEELGDGRRYSLDEVTTHFPLPVEVKVAAGDPTLPSDPLGVLPAVRLEERVAEPFLVASLDEAPPGAVPVAFEIPPRWLDLLVVLSGDPPAWGGERPCPPPVEELTEAFYFRLRRELPSDAPPPPRPPKGPDAARRSKAEGSACRRSSQETPVKAKTLPAPVKALGFTANPKVSPNAYSGVPKRVKPPPKRPPPRKLSGDSDSDHDYEIMDEELQETIRHMKEAALHY
ncbi:protein THEMIS2 isoform X2 [Ornithorhynchus anatinus]|uniref:protein THEMIS2 isoform X2 n=1 Tax=Ornithorhynchus anatinus TaxID=9258 RepID=UPI0004546336|nr:protein THEMIS2 isoform X2 [Ornithorhynchus anatinus]